MSNTNTFKNFFSKTDRDNLTLKKVLIIFLVLICIIVVLVYGTLTNMNNTEEQMLQNLADVSKQNALLLETKITTEYDLLDSLSEELVDVTPDNIEEKLSQFKIFISNFDLKRFAFCFPDGTTYSTDGDVTDLSYRDFFIAGMTGENYITGVLRDAITDDDNSVNVVVRPVYNSDGSIGGVFGLAYSTEKFNDFLQLTSFDGCGYSCIVNNNYEIMAATNNKGLSLSDDILSDLRNADSRNEESIEYLSKHIQNESEGSGIIYLDGKNYYYSVPVTLANTSVTWHVFTIVPADVLRQKVTTIQKIQTTTAFLVMLLVLIGAVMIIHLIKDNHEKIMKFAYEDPITKGANYAKFCTQIKEKYSTKGFLVSMEISNFNYISVVSGERAGNTMIKEAWDIISSSLNKNDLAGHIRDEMFLLFIEEDSESELLTRLENISDKIGERAKGFKVHGICASCGICPMNNAEPFENIYSKARIARNYASIRHESHHAFYRDVDGDKLQYEKQLEEMFPSAIENGEFEVWYQPKYNAKSCSIVGSEALVRWRNAEGNMISPGAFIPLFERNGMITRLDAYMFEAVCRQQKQWLDEGKTVYPVSVNISRASLYRMDFEKHYSDIIKKYNIDPKYIQIEITETAMEAKNDIFELLNKFRQMGIKILMDDFGTGYSSLATLSTQCFDTLKIDKTLIDHIGDNDGETILYHIIRMGQQMGLHITAEGVERKNQLEFLQNLNCDDIQGFYFSKPVPTSEYEQLIHN